MILNFYYHPILGLQYTSEVQPIELEEFIEEEDFPSVFNSFAEKKIKNNNLLNPKEKTINYFNKI